MRQSQIKNFSTPAKKNRGVSIEQFKLLEKKVDDLIKSLSKKNTKKEVVEKPKKESVKKPK